ncbi:ATP-binding protein [soil metagenome]
MPKPDDVFDRVDEWSRLEAFATDRRPGARLAVVRGRRRHGKSVLLRALASTTDGFYHQALEGSSADQLRDLGAAVMRRLGLPAGVELADWSALLDALFTVADRESPVVILDEFSYLVDAEPALPSLLQRALDARRRTGPPLRLIVCGSALSIMSTLLVGGAPLRGRASVELLVRAFDHVTAARFHAIDDPTLALRVFAVIGGVPGYSVDLLDEDLPRNIEDFDDWMVRGPLSTTRPLLYEARHLLDEPAIRDRSLYVSVLAALAAGASTNGQVAQRLGRSAPAIAHPLGLLADLEIVTRHDDPLRGRRPRWTITDPLLRFWIAVMRPDWQRIEEGRATEVWRDAAPRWQAQVVGPTVEDLARQWVSRHTTRFGSLRTVAAAVINDPKGRTQHELDIVGVDANTGRVTVIGEAKAGSVDASHLRRLERIRALLVSRDKADPAAALVLVTLGGWRDGLDADDHPDLTLVDAADLYRSPDTSPS